jgi:hypothetical protein
MAEQEKKKDDTSEYSSSKAPETQVHAEEKASEPDERLLPGGPRGTPNPTGMSGLDHDMVPNEDVGKAQRDFGTRKIE